MKNSLHILKRVALLLIFTAASTVKAHTMDETLDTTGVDRHELIKALYEHTTEQNARKSNPQVPTTRSIGSRALSFALSVASRTNILSVKRCAYNAELSNFVEEYKLDLHQATNPSCFYISDYDAVHGPGTAKSIYDQLAADTERLAAATKLLARLQMDEEKSHGNIHAEKKEEDDGLETIYFYKTIHTDEEK